MDKAFFSLGAASMWVAIKENQECVLAIDIKREAFDNFAANVVMSTYQECMYGSREDWKRRIYSFDIRVQ